MKTAVKRWRLGMDFQVGSPEAEAVDGSECFYPRQTEFVLASDCEKLEARLGRYADVCLRYLPPDGISIADAMHEIIGIFDDPELPGMDGLRQ